jgi:hypothetical protein
MKHSKIIGVIAAVVLLTCLAALPVSAAAPPLPCAFSGSVTLDGAACPGSVVTVQLTDGTPVTTLPATVTVSAGSTYNVVIAQDAVTELPAEDDTLKFYVDGNLATTTGDTATWETGGLKTVNLAAVAGAASNPDISVTTSIPFGSVTVGASKTMTLTINNVGAATLTITSITITGSQFSRGTYSGTIAAGSSATVDVTFSPTSTGAKSATLTIASNDPDEASVTVALSGTGTTRPQTFAWWLYGTFIEPFM